MSSKECAARRIVACFAISCTLSLTGAVRATEPTPVGDAGSDATAATPPATTPVFVALRGDDIRGLTGAPGIDLGLALSQRLPSLSSVCLKGLAPDARGSLVVSLSFRKDGSLGGSYVEKATEIEASRVACVLQSLSQGAYADTLGSRSASVSLFVGARPLKKLSLTREQIDSVVRREFPAINTCYEEELKSSPALAGKIVVSWTIEGTGAVERASVSTDTVGSEKLASCILARIKALRFPEPTGGGPVFVAYPFALKPR